MQQAARSNVASTSSSAAWRLTPCKPCVVRRGAPVRLLRAERRAVEDEVRTSTSTQPETQQQDVTGEEPSKITTWEYGKTPSDKDLPGLYLGLMIIPFIAMMALPFLPRL